MTGDREMRPLALIGSVDVSFGLALLIRLAERAG
jgi:hypothetical protein